MLINKTELLDKLKSEKLVIGYELGNQASQISYCHVNSGEPETLSVTAGTEQFNIPTALCKRQGVGQWFYGKEALRYAAQEEGTLLTGLLELAREGEMVMVEGAEYDPVALLTLFIKRSFTLLSLVAGMESVAAVMFTCETLDHRMIEVLTQVAVGIGLKNKKVFFQSNRESFYYYTLYQPPELWNHEVLLCDFRTDYLRVYRLECNRRTTPVVVYIETKEYPSFSYPEFPEDELLRARAMEEKDQGFLQILTECCKERIISSVYLIGDGFKEEWTKESVRFLCKSRRVFRGNNLYSKGACFGVRERLAQSEKGNSFVFLGEDKLKANIGMKVLRRGVDSYFALLDAGQNWFDSARECEFILESDNSFELRVTPLNGREAKVVEILLDGLPERPEKTSRIHMKIFLKDESTVVLVLTDKGFGELYPASGKVWREEFEI